MSHDRGVRAQRWLARYLAAWWPSAEAVGSGRQGSDVLGTPGVHWENKTAREFKPTIFVRQAVTGARLTGCLPVTVYWPDGSGEQSAPNVLAILPMRHLMDLLVAAGYAPGPPFSPDPAVLPGRPVTP